MKVLQINSVCGFGSTGRIVTDLYDMLEMHDHDCLVAYGRGNAPKEIRTYKIGSSLSNVAHAILTRLTDMHAFGSRLATKKLIKEIEKYSPDIIHLHNIHGYYVNIGILFNYLNKINTPVVWTLHDCWPFTGHCAYFDFINCERWRNGCYSCPQKSRYPASRLIDNSKWNYEKKKELFTSLKNITLLTPSYWLGELVKQSYFNSCEIKTIHNGINLSIFKPTVSTNEGIRKIKEKYGCANRYVILGVASNWESRKGMEYLLRLSTKLDDKYCIVIVGLNLKEKIGLPGNIIGLTRTNNLNELAEIYTMADVYVNPTLEEVLGLTNLEALACGTPVISFNTGGSPECIDDTCGIVVEKGSLDGLIEAIYKIKANPINSEVCSRRAKLFNKDDKFLEYINIYEELCNKDCINIY